MIETVNDKLPLLALALIGLMAGCVENGPAAGDGSSASESKKIEPEQRMVPDYNPGQAGTVELSSGKLAPVIADLASRLGASESDIRVLRAIPVIWNDGALGCPRPGQSYTQALVPGYWAVLEHDGRRYSYHAGTKGPFRLCEGLRPDPVGSPPRGQYNSQV